MAVVSSLPVDDEHWLNISRRWPVIFQRAGLSTLISFHYRNGVWFDDGSNQTDALLTML